MTPHTFFIGWQRQVARGLRRFLLLMALAVPVGGGALALLLGAAADDPAGPRFALAPGAPMPLPLGEAALTGVLTLAPYPVLHLPPDAAAPRGRAVLLADDGKRGATIDPALEGRTVVAEGFALARGDIDMLVLGAPPQPVDAAMPAVSNERLGRWRIAGEICDGKCAAGGMHPGTGLGHRACAVLCLDGELPAVFVATAPVAGHAFLLLGAAAGTRLPPGLRAHVGLRVTLEGAVERRGGMLVFLADPAPVR
jgi:hypothetical protein